MSALCRCLTAWRANFDRRRRFGVAYAARMAESDRAAQTIPGEGGATMTASWVRTAAAAASVLALQACTMPHSEYPPSADYQTPAALQSPKPQYPVNQDQPPPMQSADPHDPVASPTPPVSAQPLPPPAPPSGPTAYFGPRLTYAVAWTQPLELWQAAHHRRAHERARTRVDARGRLEAAGEAKSVKIRKGDTLRSLAKRYGTTPRALMAANGIKHPGDLAVGAPITVPGAPAALTRRERRAEAAAETHEVRAPKTYRAHRGDTIYSHWPPIQDLAQDDRGAERLYPEDPSDNRRARAPARLGGRCRDRANAAAPTAAGAHSAGVIERGGQLNG